VDVKDITLKPLDAKSANAFVCKHHYSGKVTQNSQLHIGAYYAGALHGVMQFGPSIDKHKTSKLVTGTGFHNFLELNRMAFDDVLPRNAESRCLSVACKLIKKHAPQVKWIISFADGCQCGDGTIYRAAGFLLTAVKQNSTIVLMPDGSIVANKTLANHPVKNERYWKERGAKKLSGYMMRYIKFIDPEWASRLTVPVLPYTEINRLGASMYKGKTCVSSIDSDASGFQLEKGSASLTDTLQEATDAGQTI
jgi:hypothetical protein